MKNADLALYRAKDDGRGTYHFFEPGMDAALQERREHGGRAALGTCPATSCAWCSSRCQPQGQPHQRLRGAAALGPSRARLLPPAEFIPVAEEIGPDRADRRMGAARGLRGGRRLAGRRRRRGQSLAGPVQEEPQPDRARQGGAPQLRPRPDRLELEITESVLLADNEMRSQMLQQLKALGVRIAMDDFGTGYSSLSYLRSFPFDKIKIDQSFVRDLSSSADSLAIIKAVIGLGHSLGMSTTAEGVETEDQFELIRDQGCTEVQGYLLSAPLPASAVGELLSRFGRSGDRQRDAIQRPSPS